MRHHQRQQQQTAESSSHHDQPAGLAVSPVALRAFVLGVLGACHSSEAVPYHCDRQAWLGMQFSWQLARVVGLHRCVGGPTGA